MNRISGFAGTLLVFLSLSRSSLSGAESIQLKSGPYLLLDNFLIESSSNVTRRIHSPKRDLNHPVVTAREDKNFQPYVTVLREPQTGRFRMWYDVPINAGQSHLAHIESPDGIHFVRPHQVLDDPQRIAFGASVLDEGADFAEPSWRFKFVWYNGGMMMARSPDGIRWTADPPQPVITGINDILHLARDTARKRYLAVFGFPSSREDGYQGKTQNSSEGYRRCVGLSTSTNCMDWTKPRRIFAPDSQDEGITEFYSIGGVIARGPLLIGLLKVLRDDLPCDPGVKVDGLGYTVLAWTHDGENWQRDREPFFDRNHEPGTWDHAMAWCDYQLPVGDQVYIYYGGYARGHKVERFTERQIGLVRIERDRYVAREANGEGILRTRLVTIEGAAINLNVDASQGEACLQIVDEQGKPIHGFRYSDCPRVKTDSQDAPIRWKRSLTTLRGKPVRLEMYLRNARLFGFQVE